MGCLDHSLSFFIIIFENVFQTPQILKQTIRHTFQHSTLVGFSSNTPHFTILHQKLIFNAANVRIFYALFLSRLICQYYLWGRIRRNSQKNSDNLRTYKHTDSFHKKCWKLKKNLYEFDPMKNNDRCNALYGVSIYILLIYDHKNIFMMTNHFFFEMLHFVIRKLCRSY